MNRKNTDSKPFWPWWRVVMTGLNTIALVLSGILSWHFIMGGSMAGCGGGSPCDAVLSSPWSSLAGVLPVSGLAVGAYIAMMVAGFNAGPNTDASIRRMAWSMLIILAGSIAGSAVWFTILQKWVIGSFCPYCMSAHITGFLLAALIIWRALKENFNNSEDRSEKRSEGHFIRPAKVAGMAFTGLIVAGLLATLQAALVPDVVYSDGKSQNTLPPPDYHNVPIVGSPDAPNVVTVLFDYQCTHCQKLHFMLDEVIQGYSGKLAFMLCPAPLNTSCNPYVPRDVDAFKNSCQLARIALAVWLADRDAFADFENYMFTFDSGSYWLPRSPENARAKAVELVGQAEFDAAMSDPWIDKYLNTSVQYYGQTLQGDRGGVPKMIYGSRWVIPQPEDAKGLVTILQNGLAVPMQ